MMLKSSFSWTVPAKTYRWYKETAKNHWKLRSRQNIKHCRIGSKVSRTSSVPWEMKRHSTRRWNTAFLRIGVMWKAKDVQPRFAVRVWDYKKSELKVGERWYVDSEQNDKQTCEEKRRRASLKAVKTEDYRTCQAFANYVTVQNKKRVKELAATGIDGSVKVVLKCLKGSYGTYCKQTTEELTLLETNMSVGVCFIKQRGDGWWRFTSFQIALSLPSNFLCGCYFVICRALSRANP